MGLNLSGYKPIHLIKGRPKKTEEEPVIAKTIKMRMSSHF